MKTDKDILDKAGIETVSEELTINAEIEARINTRRRLYRSIDHAGGTANYCGDDIINLPLCDLEKLQEENNSYIQKLYDLKKSISPFKHITPKHSLLYEPCAIITCSWGWEQTNIDFYCIVKRTGDFVTILPMTKQSGKMSSGLTREELPEKINFNQDPKRKKITKDETGKEIGISMSGSFGWGRLWDGEKETSTHYA